MALTLFDYGDRITELSLSHGILAATKSVQSVTEQPEKVKKKKSTPFFFSFGGSIRTFTIHFYYYCIHRIRAQLYIYSTDVHAEKRKEKKRTARGSRR